MTTMSARLPWAGLAEVSECGESVTLRRFKGRIPLPAHATTEWLETHRERVGTGVVIDVETTGLDRKTDSVIELGMRCFRFDRETGEVLTVDEAYTALQDPGRPLSQEIRELTGLSDADLAGQSIDWPRVDRILAGAERVIAHNASFDRPFIDRLAPQSRSKLWACSFRQVDWSDKRFPSSKLEILCLYHGFFTAAHRAQNDVDALLCLLALQDSSTGKAYLHELLTRATQPYVKVVAAGSPFETKDMLKARGYRWDTAMRVWQKMILNADLAGEVSWLEASVYRGSFRGTTEEIPALDNFKESL